MKLKYNLPKGYRVNRTIAYCGIQLAFEQSIKTNHYWWCYATNKWVDYDTPLPKGGSSHYRGRCRSVKAFKRLLRKWSKYLPKGLAFELVSQYDALCVIGKTT